MDIEREKIFEPSTSPAYGELAIETRPMNIEIGVELAVASRFGLRVYLLNQKLAVNQAIGSNRSTYYALAAHRSGRLVAAADPGTEAIDLIDPVTKSVVGRISGYVPTAVLFDGNDLYFAASYKGSNWFEEHIFVYDVVTMKVRPVTDVLFADVRGLAMVDDKLYIADGANGRLIEWNMRIGRPVRMWSGFAYTSALFATDHGTLLIPDTHADTILEMDRKSGKLISHTDVEWLFSPSGVIELPCGPYKGAWVVADREYDRLIVVNRKSWKVIAEVAGIAGAVDVVAIPGTCKL